MEGEAGEGAIFGEASHVILQGEGHPYGPLSPTTGFIVPYDVPIVDKSLTFEEASKCLNTLGKDESGVRYAYLMITATDRKLTDISVVLGFTHVLFLDVSGNFLNLEALQVLQGMPFLIMLRANRNRVESGALNPIHYLQVLCLNINKIEHTNDISQPMLETLQLEFNQIFTAQFDSEKLTKLKELDLKGNHLMDFSGEFPESLERLYLAQNKITRLNELALSKLTNLTALHLRDNKIRKLTGFTDFLGKLTYLNLRNNSITKLRQFRKLACLPNLEILVYTDNPMHGKAKSVVEIHGEGASDDEEVYGEDGEVRGGVDVDSVRIGVLVLLPKLKRINKNPVTLQERDEAFLTRDRKLELIMEEESSDEETEPPTTTYTSDVGDTETEADEDLLDPRRHFDDDNDDEDN